MRGCGRQSRRAQAAFYDLFARDIHVTACRILGNAQEAEEVVQEVLLRVLTRPALLLPDRTGMTRRLRRMAINECIGLLRKRHITWEDLDEQTDISDGQSLDDFLLREERTGLLRRAIAALPQQCRTVLQLVLLEELDCEEVATLLHITNSSVRAHLTRAKQKLIDYVKDERR